MGQRLGADARFVGVGAALHAVENDRQQAAARRRFAGEGVAQDQGHHRGQLFRVQRDGNQGAAQVQRGHQRHQRRGDPGDAFEAAEDHRAGGEAQQNADAEIEGQGIGAGVQPTVAHEQHFAQYLGELVGLEDGQGADHAEGGEQIGEESPAAVQPFADHVHRPALQHAVTVPAPVHHGQRAGEELGGDAEQGGHPHPEDGAGAANADGQRHAADVAHADGAGQG